MTNLNMRHGTVLRTVCLVGVTLVAAGCANEPVGHNASFASASMMMLSGPTAAPPIAVPDQFAMEQLRGISHQSLAAKVLASRALETVTGLPIDPARFSEHD